MTALSYARWRARQADSTTRATRTRHSDHATATIVGHGSKPNHATRTVSLQACWPNAPMSAGGHAAHPMSSTFATPLTWDQREGNYRRQMGPRPLTDRQWRRLYHKRSTEPVS